MEYHRILTIQDISCVGQCSMTVALPVLSACGQEACVLPAAVLSTHTGFSHPAIRDLTELLPLIGEHWQREGITFDAIYTGYLGSIQAIDYAGQIMDRLLAPGGRIIVDPAMADHGKLYAGLDEGYAAAMAALCRRADVMLPNLTEAAMMTGTPYREHYSREELSALLAKLGGRDVVLTGTEIKPGSTGVAIRRDGEIEFYSHRRVGRSYHGTGDLFAACFTGAWMGGKPMEQAARIAAEFVCFCIENTFRDPNHWYGVKFETALPALMEMLKTE